MLPFLTILSLLLVVYVYFGYPILVSLLPSRKSQNADAEVDPLSVGIVITLRNEEQVVRTKLEATLALRYQGKLLSEHLAEKTGLVRVLVASDASDDDTDEVVKRFADRGVELVRLPERGGKERAQKAAVATLDTDLVLFTDAKIELNEDAVENFVTYFSDESVGAVSSSDKIITDEGTSSGEGFYVRYEMWLRKHESRFNSLVGLSGSCFTVRKQIADALRDDIPSDFALLLETQRQGLRGVHADDVVGSYKAVRTESEEFSRKVRTVLRGITACFANAEVLNFGAFGIFSWQIWSHKVGRWMVPWLLLISFVGSMILMANSAFFGLLFLGMMVFYLAALAGYVSPQLQSRFYVKVPLFFCVVNAGIAVAWVKYLSGQRSVTWTPSRKGA